MLLCCTISMYVIIVDPDHFSRFALAVIIEAKVVNILCFLGYADWLQFLCPLLFKYSPYAIVIFSCEPICRITTFDFHLELLFIGCARLWDKASDVWF